MQQVLFWNASVLILLAVIAEPLFSFLLTDKWLQAVPYFQILALAGTLYPLHSYNLNILKVKGRSDLILRLELIKKGLCVAGIFAVIPFGIYGLLYFQLIFNFAGYYINSIYSGKMINYSLREQISDIAPILATAVFAGIVSYITDILLFKSSQPPNMIRIVIDSLFFFTIYIGSSLVLKIAAISEFKQLILKR